MKTIAYAVACFAFLLPSAFAQAQLTVPEISTGIIQAVTHYAQAISCTDAKVDAKHIAALVPYRSPEDSSDAKYAVVWVGDIGCLGGTGTMRTNIAVVTIGSGYTFLVDPSQSSPIVQFEAYGSFTRLVGNTHDSLIIDASELGSNDAHCCPSVPIRVTLSLDGSGNWKRVKKYVLPSK